MRSGLHLLFDWFKLTGQFAHGFALEGESQGVMNNTVEDGIGEGGILNLLMPVFDGELRGKQTGGFAIAVIEEIEDFPGMIGGQLIPEPFIENDQIKGSELFTKSREGAIGLGK